MVGEKFFGARSASPEGAPRLAARRKMFSPPSVAKRIDRQVSPNGAVRNRKFSRDYPGATPPAVAAPAAPILPPPSTKTPNEKRPPGGSLFCVDPRSSGHACNEREPERHGAAKPRLVTILSSCDDSGDGASCACESPSSPAYAFFHRASLPRKSKKGGVKFITNSGFVKELRDIFLKTRDILGVLGVAASCRPGTGPSARPGRSAMMVFTG